MTLAQLADLVAYLRSLQSGEIGHDVHTVPPIYGSEALSARRTQGPPSRRSVAPFS